MQTGVALPKHDPFLFMKDDGSVISFNIATDQMEVNGLHHGQRYSFTPNDKKHKTFTACVIGEYNSVVFWSRDWSGAYPLVNCIEGCQKHLLFTTAVKSYNDNIKEHQTNTIVITSNSDGIKIALDKSCTALSPFGISHGMVVGIGNNLACALGIWRGNLYGVLKGKQFPECLSTDYKETSFTIPNPCIIKSNLLELHSVRVPLLKPTIQYLSTCNIIRVFLRSDTALSQWNVKGDDVVLFQKGPHCGSSAVVIGIRERYLWFDFFDRPGVASPISIPNPNIFHQTHSPVVSGYLKLEPYTG